ncbi:P-loop containing nucleoside triphosphate hydrolase protein [Polychytrium aggregatum]|uniref:P-loop containing nucleoside triphosphate hydrolase protein n=1 Tax=Polychytrium aggregatum TaxID=110093 RepID=UPI0022FEBBB6|nr:P-loop containing nucleoside triphosphate hydrolase protein [Polychytrium aggregatum]KAI9197416.1 P-loop containing nucleoside triphosphate hydrolase protein [Polychytrium aggregatum]
MEDRIYSSSFLGRHSPHAHHLPAEVEEGNVEYKLKLIDPSPERVQHLITQMKWRLSEGHGEAMYEIGVADNGELVGLTRADMDQTIATLRMMSQSLSAEISLIRERPVPTAIRMIAEVLVRKCLVDQHHFLEIRVAIIGAADAGKSTLLGVLTHGEADNGNGKARLNLLRHRHEIQTGRTSSLSQQIIGFTASGELLNYATTNITRWEQICEIASKVVTFLDTCGHPKYQRTTLAGLTGHAPHYACLIISASASGLPEISRDHFGMAMILKVPLFIVITKVDIATIEQLTRTMNALFQLLKSPGVRRVPFVIQTKDDVCSAAANFDSSKIIPVFLTSSVTGENLHLVAEFLNLLKKPGTTSPAPGKETQLDKKADLPFVFQIDDYYDVPDVGQVVGGIAVNGRVQLRGPLSFLSQYYIGPHKGKFYRVLLVGAHRQRCPVSHVQAGQAATFAVHIPKADLVVSKRRIPAMTKSASLTPLSRPKTDQRKIKNRYSTPEFLAFDGAEKHTTPAFKVRKGMVILESVANAQGHYPVPRASLEFIADLHILYAPGRLHIGTQGIVYCRSIQQSARLVEIVEQFTTGRDTAPPGKFAKSTAAAAGGGAAAAAVKTKTLGQDVSTMATNPSATAAPPAKPPQPAKHAALESSTSNTLKSGDKVRVRLRFLNEPEWMGTDSMILFRDGRMKCVGKIVQAL